MDMLRVVNLGVEIGGRRILENVNLYIREGETLALFGPNGSGKTTLLNALIGNPSYKIVSGRVIFKKKDITSLPPDERAKMGMGISFQTPPKISGVKLIDVLKYCAKIGGYREEDIFEMAKRLKLEDHLYRAVNVGFSGGEVKRSEILQLMLMNPDFVMLDEPDSGVDLENIVLLGEAMKELLERNKKKDERKKAGIIITHQGYILDYVDADYGVVLYRGKVACMGDPADILRQIRKYGYEGCMEKCLKEI
ncbi:MAG: ABC transporter ATP-binding protein [Archaeoglobales archaeon]|nr:ABC transporter ATP-binding protein [Archaeoglobales archaeon]